MSAESTDGPEPVEPPPSREAVFIPPVREWAVADLRDAEYNPREITDRQLADLQASIEDFGLVEDVVVNVHPQRRGVVVGGHQKLRILRAKGVDRVPCKEVELTQERERELNVRLNANGGQFSGKLLFDWGFDRERLEDWGMGLEDLAAFDHAASMVGAGAAADDGEADGGVNWGGMPGFDHDDLEPWAQMKVSFRSPEDREAFGKLIGQTFTDKTKSIWYPVAPYEQVSNMRFRSTDERPPRYPVYVISKGRWDSRLTVKALEEIGIRFSLVVEPQELDRYAAVVDPAKILTLPFSNLGQGSIPARNWVWDHALAAGSERHWILDDNIRGFWRFQNNFKYRVGTAATRLAAVPTVVALPPDLFAALRERLDLAGLRGPRADGSLDLAGVVAVSAPEAGPPESAETPDAPASTATAASPFDRARAATLTSAQGTVAELVYLLECAKLSLIGVLGGSSER